MLSVNWRAFTDELRRRQDELRAELRPYENRSMQVGRRAPGGAWEDFTDERIATIKREIASLQRTINQVTEEQGLRESLKARAERSAPPT